MKRILIPIFLAGLFLVGCGAGGVDPKLVQNPTKTEMDAAKARRAEAVAIYKRANGEWTRMSAEDRARIIELSGGNESLAQQGWPVLGRLDP